MRARSSSRRASGACAPPRREDPRAGTRSWSAGMAHAARVFGKHEWLACARGARPFIRTHCGATGGCSPRTRTAGRTSTPTSTTTRSCSPRCSRCCRPTSTPPTSPGPRSSPTLLMDAVPGHGARRLLLHRARPREAHPPPEARPRQRDALGQRGRRAVPQSPRLHHRRDALSRRRGAHARPVLAAALAPARGLLQHARAARGGARAAAHRDRRGAAGALRPLAPGLPGHQPARHRWRCSSRRAPAACRRRSPSPLRPRSTPGCARALHACRPWARRPHCGNR